MITSKQAATIREMAMAERPNADIIKTTALPVAEAEAEHDTVNICKMDFVTNYLAPLLKAIDETITEVEYSVRTDLTETVNIHFKPSGRLIINVTGDSLAALTRDVLRRIE